MTNPNDLTLAAAVRRAAGPGAVPRPGQQGMSDAVATSLADRHDMVGQAPVGTGKSLAYLAPAVRMADAGKRVLVSVSSKALQDQVAGKDFANAAGPSTVKVAVLKGRASYACHLRAESADAEANRWIRASDDGDLSGAGEAVADQLRPNLATCSWKSCPMYSYCFAARAQAAAGEADVVVTNHAMLATQATTPTSPILGSRTVGTFDAIILDEAHTVPDWIRSIGRVRIDDRLMAELARTTQTALRRHPRSLEEVAGLASEFEDVTGGSIMTDAARKVLSPPIGWGWWVEDDDVYVAGPVMTSPILRSLWSCQEGVDRPGVVAVSGTLPNWRDLGLDHPTHVSIDSPFASAYHRSLLYVPDQSQANLAALAGPGGRFDSSRHLEWAMDDVVALTTAAAAGGGGSLVLTATSEGARRVARRLARAGLVVMTQWDEGYADAWRADTTSVLVGTRSLMTGLDAPGDTCRLVIIDRVPRNAANPADDMRVRAAVELRRQNEHVAREGVYAGDAAMLLEQGTGRLIRSATDWGVLAVLDPRLAPGPWSYRGGAATMYRAALAAYGTPTHDVADAVSLLEAGR